MLDEGIGAAGDEPSVQNRTPPAGGRPAGLSFQVLGPLEVRRGGTPVQLRGTRERTLLAILLSERNRAVPLSRLVTGLWGAQPPASAERTVQAYVARLRPMLEPERPEAGWSVLVTSPTGYCLRVDDAAFDAASFARLVDRAQSALVAGAPDLALTRFRRAEAMWRGDEPYQDLADVAYLTPERDRLIELRLTAAADRLDAERALGRAAGTVGDLRRLVADHPTNERFWGQLMVALYESQRQKEALDTYRAAWTRLVDDGGIEPGPKLRALHDTIVSQRPVEVAWPVRPGDVPAPLSADRTPLIGRDGAQRWLRDVWDQVLDDVGRLVVVEAEPGGGASRLLAEFARTVAARGAVVETTLTPALTTQVAQRPVLVVVDQPAGPEPAEAVPAGLGPAGAESAGVGPAGRGPAWVKRVAAAVGGSGRPVLVVVVVAASDRAAHPDEWADAVPAERVLRLGPLGGDAVGNIVAGYVQPADLDEATSVILDTAGGNPARVHEAAARWAAERARAQAGRSAERMAAVHRTLAQAEQEMLDDVTDLQRVRASRAPGPDTVVCPYKGLARFDEADAAYFFGRQRLIAQLVTGCVAAPLLTVVGPSGSGKSSVVRAGLLPALRAGALPGSERWRYTPLRTGATDEAALRAVLRDGGAEDPDGTDLLVLDQFEEAFTAWSPATRTAVVDWLVGELELRDGRLRVVITVRADYYGRFAHHPTLARLIGRNTLLVGPMTDDELSQAIEQPARVAGLGVEDGFVAAVLGDAKHEPGALPLLSTALLATWERRDGRMLRTAAYREAGGVAGAVTRLAEDVYKGLDPGEQAIARRLLLRLVSPGEDGLDVRRRAARDELVDSDAADRILTLLVERRLVTADDDTVEVAHEALLRAWPRLRGWLEADRDGRRLHRQLTEAAAAWQRSDQDPGYLYHGTRLHALQEWAQANPGDANALERLFLAASVAVEERQLRDARRSARRSRSWASVLAILLVVALTMTVLAVVQWSAANQQANVAREATTLSQAGRLATLAANLGPDQVDLALLLGVQGYQLAPSRDTEGGLQAALARTPANLDQIIRFPSSSFLPAVVPPSVSPDGRLVAAPGQDGTVRLWDLHAARIVRELHWPTGRQLAVFSADASMLAVGGSDGKVVVWEVATGRQVGAPIPAGTGLAYGQFDPRDPDRFFAVDNSGQIVAWDRSVPERPRQLGQPLRFPAAPGEIPIFVLNATGTRMAAGAYGRPTTRVWDIDSGAVLRDLAGAPGFFGADGVTLPTSLRDRVTLWDVNTGLAKQELTGLSGAAPGIVLSQNLRRLAVNDGGNAIRIFDVGSGREQVTLSAAGRASTPVAFLADGRLMTSGAAEADIWRLDRGGSPLGFTLAGHDGRVTGSFTASGTEVITQGLDDHRVLVWDAADGRELGPLLNGAVSAPVALSPDGARIVGVGANGVLRLWDRAGKTELAVLAPADHPAAVEWSPAGDRVAAVHAGGVLLWDVGDPHRPRLVADLDTAGSTGSTGQPRPAFSPDGQRLAVTDQQGHRITMFDAATGRSVWLRQLETADQATLAFSPDSTKIAIGFGTIASGFVEFLDTSDGTVRRHLNTTSVGGVAFLRDGDLVMTTSDTGDQSSVQLWDATTTASVGEPATQAHGAGILARSPDGMSVVAGSDRGIAQVWHVDLPEWMATACRIAGRNLTRVEWERYLPGEPYRASCAQWPPTP
ncbi:transcriptional activator domain [Parafrankia sp. EAN1pec]|uniref:nSTAND1 domain-containing NTPase n=1 Tax=Parafrankia sp. (strain EAN1pec) TaxID=298653 RepID=UPI00015D9DDF|nr:transcriptional activator domain [Frankia sp. EAN1pec]